MMVWGRFIAGLVLVGRWGVFDGWVIVLSGEVFPGVLAVDAGGGGIEGFKADLEGGGVFAEAEVEVGGVNEAGVGDDGVLVSAQFLPGGKVEAGEVEG